jgi:hypothetical protein
MVQAKLGEAMSVQSTQNETFARPINRLAIAGIVMAVVAMADIF